MSTKSKSLAASAVVWLVVNERGVTAAVVVILAMALVGAVDGPK